MRLIDEPTEKCTCSHDQFSLKQQNKEACTSHDNKLNLLYKTISGNQMR